MTRLDHSRNRRERPTPLPLIWAFLFTSFGKTIKAFACKVCSPCFISVDTEMKEPHIWSHISATAAATELGLYYLTN